MMAAVLLRLKASGLLDEYPSLSAYVLRAEARPAYQRAFAAQLAVFVGAQSPDRQSAAHSPRRKIETNTHRSTLPNRQCS